LVIYLYYQQNQPNYLNVQSNNQEVQELRNQVNHYQTLYQKRVVKDLESDQSEKINQLTTDYAELSTKHTKTLEDKAELEKSYQDHLKLTKEEEKRLKQEQVNLVANLSSETHTKNLYSQKIESLETQLLNLAKNKLKGKKQAQELLTQLESNWKQDKVHWEQEKTNLITTYQQEKEHQQALQDYQKKKDEEVKTTLEEVKKQLADQLTQIKKLEQERDHFKNDLNSILNKWQWDDKPVKSSKEFLNKMEPWIREKIKETAEVKQICKKHEIKSLNELEEQLENKEKDYLKQIEQLETSKNSEIISKLEEENKNSSKTIEELKNQVQNLQEALVEEEKHRDRNHESAKQKDEIIKEMAEELKQTQEKIKELEERERERANKTRVEVKRTRKRGKRASKSLKDSFGY